MLGERVDMKTVRYVALLPRKIKEYTYKIKKKLCYTYVVLWYQTDFVQKALLLLYQHECI